MNIEYNENKYYKIWKNEYKKEDGNKVVNYSTSLSHKKMNSTEYEYGNIPVHFRKDVELHNGAKICINQAWLDFYNTEFDLENGKKGKKTTIYLFINDFDVIDANEPAPNDEEEDGYNNIILEDDDLPF